MGNGRFRNFSQYVHRKFPTIVYSFYTFNMQSQVLMKPQLILKHLFHTYLYK